MQLQGFRGTGQGHFQLVEEVVSPKRRTTYDGLKMCSALVELKRNKS